jgi:putative toxin-antitoxin system antitoxin component (TIGR02293 family)
MKKKSLNTVKEPQVFYGPFAHYESDFSNPLRMMSFVNEGVPVSSLDALVSLSQHGRELFAQRLNISTKTIERYQKEGKSFDPVMSELILQWVQMYRKGSEVFGSIASFNRWLGKPALAFEGLVPESFTHTSGGVRLILDALMQIEMGDLS